MRLDSGERNINKKIPAPMGTMFNRVAGQLTIAVVGHGKASNRNMSGVQWEGKRGGGSHCWPYY